MHIKPEGKLLDSRWYLKGDLHVIDIKDFKRLHWSMSCLCPVFVNKGFISLNGEMILKKKKKKSLFPPWLASVCSEELAEENSFVTPR